MAMTPNTVALIATDELTQRAQAIRDAVAAKSVTAEQVGSLFLDLIATCGNVRDALALFLDTNVGEIQADIDIRLQGADAAAQQAAAAAQRAEATRQLVDELVARLSSQNLYVPTRIEITRTIGTVTIRNTERPRIEARTLPAFGVGGVLFISDNKAVGITPDGRITPLALGTSTVQAVATADTSLYETLTIEVVPPRMRLTAQGGIRLDRNGNIRLT